MRPSFFLVFILALISLGAWIRARGRPRAGPRQPVRLRASFAPLGEHALTWGKWRVDYLAGLVTPRELG
jgi:hypothetical protein